MFYTGKKGPEGGGRGTKMATHLERGGERGGILLGQNPRTSSVGGDLLRGGNAEPGAYR